MPKTAPKIHASTQGFIEVEDIREDIVLLKGSAACLILEVQSVNFALLSQEEQRAKIYSYASFLNSLSFPIQILVQNKRVDITSYVKLLDAEIAKTQSEKLATYIGLYRNFVQELVKVNTVLDKRFYIALPYSSLEKGANAGTVQKGLSTNEQLFAHAKQVLHTKADAVQTQLARVNLRVKILQKEDLIKMYYEFFNRDLAQTQLAPDMQTPIVKGQ